MIDRYCLSVFVHPCVLCLLCTFCVCCLLVGVCVCVHIPPFISGIPEIKGEGGEKRVEGGTA